MKHLSAIILLLVTGCSSGYEGIVDCYSTGQFRRMFTPSFHSYLMNVRSDNLSRVDVYIQMPYRHLRFEKTADGLFKASYSLNMIIRNENRDILQTKEVDRPIFARSYEESVSSRFDFHFVPFNLQPNTYLLEIIAVDNLSNLRYRSAEKFTAENFTPGNIAASSVLYLDSMYADEKGISLRPMLPASISLLYDSVGIFQEIYNIEIGDTVVVSQRYLKPTASISTKREFTYMLPPYSLATARCRQQFDSVYFSSDSQFIAGKRGTHQIFQFFPTPETGNTELVRSVFVKKGNVVDSAINRRAIYRRDYQWRTTPSPDEIAFALQFLLRSDEYDSLTASRLVQNSSWIKRFWEPRGGIDRQTEFERKVSEANALFTSCTDGSATAMGIVYIICGTPDYIECRGHYNETWFYTVGERTYTIQFRRYEITGENFELIPFTVSDSFWQYCIERWRKRL